MSDVILDPHAEHGAAHAERTAVAFAEAVRVLNYVTGVDHAERGLPLAGGHAHRGPLPPEISPWVPSGFHTPVVTIGNRTPEPVMGLKDPGSVGHVVKLCPSGS